MEILIGPVAPVTVMVQVALPPSNTGTGDPPQDDEMLTPVVTVSSRVVVEISAPEAPVMASA